MSKNVKSVKTSELNSALYDMGTEDTNCENGVCKYLCDRAHVMAYAAEMGKCRIKRN